MPSSCGGTRQSRSLVEDRRTSASSCALPSSPASCLSNLAVRAIGAWQRRVARRRGLRAPQTGAITFVQRFGGLVNLNVHFHLLVPDGVFIADEGRLAFALHPVPTSADVVAILDRIVRRSARRLADEARDEAGDKGVDVLAQGSRPRRRRPGVRRPTASRPCVASSGCARGSSPVLLDLCTPGS